MREWALQVLALHFPRALYAEAVAVVRTIIDEERWTRALEALAPHLPPELHAEALAIARALTSEWQQFEALHALVPQLPPGEQSAVYAEVLVAARHH